MVLTGTAALIAAGLLSAWFGLLCLTSWKTFRLAGMDRTSRVMVTAFGLALSSVAVLSSLILDLSWMSVDISQRMGSSGVHVIAMFLFWPSILGLALCLSGSKRIRFVGAASCLATGFWWLMLLMGSAISMGAPIARHPVRYLIPNGYVGWVKIKRGENAPPLPLLQGKYICRVPLSGSVDTSTLTEDGWAADEYFYYDGQTQLGKLRETGWGGGGMIWGGMTQFESTQGKIRSTRMVENFFIGTEDQYHRSVDQN